MGDSWRDEIYKRQKALSVAARFKANDPLAGSAHSQKPGWESFQHAVFQKKRYLKTPAQLEMIFDNS